MLPHDDVASSPRSEWSPRPGRAHGFPEGTEVSLAAIDDDLDDDDCARLHAALKRQNKSSAPARGFPRRRSSPSFGADEGRARSASAHAGSSGRGMVASESPRGAHSVHGRARAHSSDLRGEMWPESRTRFRRSTCGASFSRVLVRQTALVELGSGPTTITERPE